MPDMKTDGVSFNTARLETFSDAVMAVAITLMVLRIDPPQTSPGQSLGEAFVQVTLPAIIYFLVTFGVIVIFWMHHHDLFILLPEFTPMRALWLNMGFLAMICLLPFGLEFFSTQRATRTSPCRCTPGSWRWPPSSSAPWRGRSRDAGPPGSA